MSRSLIDLADRIEWCFAEADRCESCRARGLASWWRGYAIRLLDQLAERRMA